MAWGQWEERVINRNNPRQSQAVREFVTAFGLAYDPASVEHTIALYQDGRMIATGSRGGEVLRNIAVHPDLQGEGLTATIVSALMRQGGEAGVRHFFIFTKPSAAPQFTGLGFHELARVEPQAVLLEGGLGSIQEEVKRLSAAVGDLPSGDRAALVVNCNPFTRGHQAVIARAAAAHAGVVVLVVSEDRSLFPFAVRLRLVQEGVAHLPNVRVVEAGKYIISAATFPDYFTRGEDTVIAQTRLDAHVFGNYIAPGLGVAVRYVGEEPYCEVTRAYNQALQEVLPSYGVKVVEIPRLAEGSEPISASRVRELLRQGAGWEQVAPLVPESTLRYLRSPAAAEVLAAIRASDSRH